ncbi:hypothetical protein D3C76_1015030 [compost metagenome]
MEGAVTGVRHGAVRLQDLEEATAVDRHVQRVLGGLQAAGDEALLGADNAHTGTDLQARRQLAVLGRLRTRLTLDLVEQVCELGTVTLEAGGGNVGQVVGNDRQVGVLGGQAGFSDPKSRKHVSSPRAPVLRHPFKSD